MFSQLFRQLMNFNTSIIAGAQLNQKIFNFQWQQLRTIYLLWLPSNKNTSLLYKRKSRTNDGNNVSMIAANFSKNSKPSNNQCVTPRKLSTIPKLTNCTTKKWLKIHYQSKRDSTNDCQVILRRSKHSSLNRTCNWISLLHCLKYLSISKCWRRRRVLRRAKWQRMISDWMICR